MLRIEAGGSKNKPEFKQHSTLDNLSKRNAKLAKRVYNYCPFL